jgi:glutaredoxin 3
MRAFLVTVATLFLLFPLSLAGAEEMRANLVPQSPLAETPHPENPSSPPNALPDGQTEREILPEKVLAQSPLPQSKLPPEGLPDAGYPKIVLYSVSWCPHCKAAKEYLTENNIPFINKDVELDPEAYELLTKKYKSNGVPVLVIGDDAEVIKGFDEEGFSKVLEKYKKK